MEDLCAVVVACSDDLRFLEACLSQLQLAASKAVVAFGSRRWNGEPEDAEAIAAFARRWEARWPGVGFVQYRVPEDRLPAGAHPPVADAMYWEAHARWLALQKLDEHIAPSDYVLLLDADEVLDGRRTLAWLASGEYRSWQAMKLLNWWYFREPTLRARGYTEDSAVLIRRGALLDACLFSDLGRHGAWQACRGLKRRAVGGVDGLPLCHHYSWVRSKAQMLAKVRAWGHREDRDWPSLVEEEFAGPFGGTDFVKGLRYDVVDNSFGL